MKSHRERKATWSKLSIGSPVSDEDLQDSLQQIERALPFLESHPDFTLAKKEALRLRMTLEDMSAARRRLEKKRAV